QCVKHFAEQDGKRWQDEGARDSNPGHGHGCSFEAIEHVSALDKATSARTRHQFYMVLLNVSVQVRDACTLQKLEYTSPYASITHNAEHFAPIERKSCMSLPRSEKMVRIGVFILAALYVAALSFGVALAQGGSSAGNAAAAGASLAVSLVSAVCGLVIFVAAIGLTVWVYQDANKRGTNGCLWALVSWFIFPIGTILYILLRPKTTL